MFLLATNILSVTSAGINGLMYELLSFIPFDALLYNSPIKKQKTLEVANRKLRNQNKELSKKIRSHRTQVGQVRKVSERIAKRTVKNVALNVTSVAGEAVPYLGAALVVAVTVADVKAGCDTVRDVNKMLLVLDTDSIDSQVDEVCGIVVPNTNQILNNIKQDIGGTVAFAKENTTASGREFYDALGGTLSEIFD